MINTQKRTLLILFFSLISYITYGQCNCPSGVGALSGTTLASGEKCIKTPQTLGGLTVTSGATLYITADTDISGSIFMQTGGKICIADGVFVSVTGSLTMQDGQIEFGEAAHMTVQGTFSFISGSSLTMNNCSLIEICASFSTSGSMINYSGDGTCMGYISTKGSATGDNVTNLSNSNQIAFIPRGTVTNIKKGNAVRCNSAAGCPAIWPNGIGGGGTCNRAEGTVTNLVNTFLLSNDPPVVDLDNSSGGNNYTTTFTEDVSTNLLISDNATITDTDDTNIESATITLTNEQDGADEGISLTTAQITAAVGNGITASINAANTIITLTGSATKANYQNIIRQIIYNNTDNNPNTTNRTITVVANDGDDVSNTATTTISIVRTNDVPVLDLDNATAGENFSTTFTEDASTNLLISNNATVTDTDDTNIESATITLTNEQDGTDEGISLTTAQITAAAGNGITASINAANTTITLTGSATKANYQNVIRQIVYTNTSNNPNTTDRTITVVTNDGDSASNTATATISIISVDDDIVALRDEVTLNENASTSYNVVSNDSDPDGSIQLSTLKITTDVNNGTTSVDNTTGEISYTPNTNFNGKDSLIYEVCSNNIVIDTTTTGTPTSYIPTADRTCDCSPADTRNITGGTSTGVGTHTLNAGDSLCIVASGGGTATMTGTITMNGGKLFLCSTDGTSIQVNPSFAASASTSGGDIYAFTNTSFTTNKTIEGFNFHNYETLTTANIITIKQDVNDGTDGYLINHVGADISSTANITTASDGTFLNYGTAVCGGMSSSGTINSGVENHGEITVNGNLLRSYGVTKNYGIINITGNLTLGGGGSSVMDLSRGVFFSNNLTINSGTYYADASTCTVFNVSNTTKVTCGNTYPNGNINIIDDTPNSGVCPADVTAGKFNYTTAAAAPVCATTLTNGTCDTAYLVFEVLSINDAPILDLDNATAGNNFNTSFVEDISGNSIAIANNTTITDIDDTNIESATITLTNRVHGIGQENISLTTTQINNALSSFGITVDISTTDVISLSGTSSIANYQTVIDQIVYNNTNNNPNLTDRTIQVVINDGDDDSNTATTTISITRTNDAPNLDLDNATAGNNFSTSFTEGTAIAITNSVSIADPDDTNIESATITLTNEQDGADEGIDISTANQTIATGYGITVSINASNTVITLSGTATIAEYEEIIDYITYDNTN
ncbi:MAG: hypothetical protein GY827_06475, partial [Cytophagales bacterium]|nr:hypothetical protein [Cytophagales bacterium]